MENSDEKQESIIAFTGKREKFQWTSEQERELNEALREILGLDKFRMNKFKCID